MEMVREIGKFKKTNKLPILNNKRHQTVIKKWQIQAEKHSLSKEFIENMYELIHEHAITIEADC
jgi:chorismate mutase